MFNPSDRFHTDPFARHHAAIRASEERAARTQEPEGRQQRIRDAAAKREALTRPDPRYKPNFPGVSPV